MDDSKTSKNSVLLWSRDDSRLLDELKTQDGKCLAYIQPNMSAREMWEGYNVTLNHRTIHNYKSMGVKS